ncbi:F-box and wd40 domain [Lecanosticta acicola]|uniref:F-box and wd40 domain n=1 Tax=Lecanosticta acicola TaxID=111012 RepID=A0AAI8YSF1_9PEZI|nr:F-box and wd40 domain [Lecanosticta acicola]
MAMTASGHGHCYGDSQLKGHARAHFGDNISVHNNYLSAEPQLIDLPTAPEASFDSRVRQDDPLCLPGTRVEVLERIRSWILGDESSCIFWLSGMAGTGKSTIARTIARESSEGGYLGASFFFTRGKRATANADLFFTTLALQLTINKPALKTHVAEAVRAQPDIASKSRTAQWQRLIAQPIERMAGGLQQEVLVFVIDALDECGHDADMEAIVGILAEATEIKSTRLRIISHEQTRVARATVNDDLRLFFHDQFNRVKRRQDWIAKDWPDNTATEELVRLAEGLFIFAATICRFIAGSRSAQKSLDQFICSIRPSSAEKISPAPARLVGPSMLPLDMLYTNILIRSIEADDQFDLDGDDFDETREILGLLLALKEELSIQTVAGILGRDTSEIYSCLQGLESLIHVPSAGSSGGIRILHASLRDFLFDQERCRRALARHSADARLEQPTLDRLWIDKHVMHGVLAEQCLARLAGSSGLRYDMCELQDPGAERRYVNVEIIHKISPDVAYACCHWANHATEAQQKLRSRGVVHDFLKVYLLHWLEALSWLGKLSQAIYQVKDLESLVETAFAADLAGFLYDAWRFLLENRNIIDTAPLQVYYGALVSVPKTSVLRSLFFDRVSAMLDLIPEAPERWPPQTLACVGHTSFVNALAFSPDGTLIASGSDDGTMRLWNISTGEELHKYEIRSECVCAVAFSADGQTVAAATENGTVLRCNVKTGRPVHQFISIPIDSSAVPAFAADLSTIAMGSGRRLTVWHLDKEPELKLDAEINTSIYQPQICISPNGQLIAIATKRGAVDIFDCADGKSFQLTGHTTGVEQVAFAPNGEMLASASFDQTLRLWDVRSKQELSRLDHDGDILCIAFASNGMTLVSASKEKRRSPNELVSIWNLRNGTTFRLQDRQEVTGGLNIISCSYDGNTIASADFDSAIRLWTARSDGQTRNLPGHTSVVRSVTSSTQGNIFVSIDMYGTLCAWDAERGKILRTLHSSPSRTTFDCRICDISGDEKIVVSFDASAMMVWDVGCGAQVCKIETTITRRNKVKLSWDGGLVAVERFLTARLRSRVSLWNARTGQHLRDFDCERFCRYLSFQSHTLHTGHEELEIGEYLTSPEPTYYEPRKEVEYSRSIDKTSSGWIRYRGHNVLLLPFDWKGTHFDIDCIHGRTIAIGQKSGTLSFYRFRAHIPEDILRVSEMEYQSPHLSADESPNESLDGS